MVSFSDLGIGPAIVRELNKQGISEPFEVQKESIPDSLLGRDVCCRAPTGSGKTLAFGLPLIARTRRANSKRPTSLILTPTRELAEQINSVLRPIAQAVDRDIVSIYGGVSYKKQYNALNKGVDILVACPGRLIDLLDRRALKLDDVETVVLDEADRMADMGFMEPVCEILDLCAENRQTILFSATLDEDVSELVKNYQNNPVTIEVGPKEVSIENMQHLFWTMKPHQKLRVTSEILTKCGKTMIFCKTRRGVDRLGDEMYDAEINVATLHGGLNQRQRDRALRRFTKGGAAALVATDVAARGIDIQGVNCVIHYDPPENGKAYKHRSGRTARAGEFGNVVSLVQHPQKNKWSKIQKEVGLNVEYLKPVLDDLTQHEDISYIKPEKRKSNQQQRSNYSRGHQKRGGRYQGQHRGRSQSRGQSRDQSQSRSQSQRHSRNRKRSQY